MSTGLPCSGKVAFWTKGQAKRAARLFAVKHGGKRNRTYHCEHCTMYHLTSRNRKILEWHQAHPEAQQNPKALESLRRRQKE